MQGYHFLEAALNNGNGTLIELLGAFDTPLRPAIQQKTKQELIALSPLITEVFMSISLVKADLLQIRVKIHCKDSSDTAEVLEGVLNTAYDVAAHAKGEGFTLYWDGDREGDKVYLEGELSDFESKIRRALGGK